MNNRRMSTDCHRLVTQPRKAFTNIFNVFACNCHDNIIGLCHLLLFRTFFTYKGKCLIREQTIFCINLAVMDARHTLCKKIFLLKVSSTRNCCNFAQFLIFHTIRAKFPEQFIQLRHLIYSPYILILIWCFLFSARYSWYSILSFAATIFLFALLSGHLA